MFLDFQLQFQIFTLNFDYHYGYEGVPDNSWIPSEARSSYGNQERLLQEEEFYQKVQGIYVQDQN